MNDYEHNLGDEEAIKAYRKQEAERAKAEAKQIAEVDAKEEAYRKKNNIDPKVKGYQHMIAAEAEEKAMREKAIEDLTNKKGTNLNREATRAVRGGAGAGAESGFGIQKMNKPLGRNYKKGGKVKSASARADGCAIRGKTRA